MTTTPLQNAMVILLQIFDKYASKEGKKDTLTQGEVKTLLEKELPGMLQSAKDPAEVEKLLKGLDINGDSEVDFSEFGVLVISFTCAIHGLIHGK